MTDTLHVVAFDGDDTLWHDITLFWSTQERFIELLSHHHAPEWIKQKVYETEMRNLKHLGYGPKGFTISLIETAIELTEGRITGKEIQQIIAMCKEMIAAPVDLIDGAEDALRALAPSYDLMMITKGDLFDQEAKLARSGLGGYFKRVEIVSDKSPEAYRGVLEKYGIAPREMVMVGNSLRSDVLPVLAVGAHAVHIPYHTTWTHEQVPADQCAGKRFHLIEHIRDLPATIEEIARGGGA